MTQLYNENSYIEKYAEDAGVFQFLLEKVQELTKSDDLLSLERADFSRLRFIAKLDFERVFETLKKYSEKSFHQDKDASENNEDLWRVEEFWQIKEAGLQWTQATENKITRDRTGFPIKAKTVLKPKIDFKIIDRGLLEGYLVLKAKVSPADGFKLKLTKDYRIIREGCTGEVPLKKEVQKQLCAELFNLEPNCSINTTSLLEKCYQDEDDSKDLREKRINQLIQIAKRLNKKIEIVFKLKKTIEIGVNESSRTH